MPSPKPDLSRETAHGGIVVGIDEAGRGPWAGPVVAAAVIIGKDRSAEGINDSKKLSAKQRERLFDVILATCRCGIGSASVEEIDTLNILQATKLAMRRAVEALGIVPDLALVDGNQPPALPCKVQTLVGGDGLSLSIAAASILATVTRDRIMCELARDYQGYGWESNAGYGTAAHQKGLASLGVTIHHRRSYAPIKSLLDKNASAA